MNKLDKMNADLKTKHEVKTALDSVRSPKTAKRGRGRPKGRKNNTTLVREQAKEVAADIYGKELEDIKKHAEETVQNAIYTNIGPIIEKMAEQAKEGNFSQQKEFLKRVSPETKAIDADKMGGAFTININVAEYTRDEPIIIEGTIDEDA